MTEFELCSHFFETDVHLVLCFLTCGRAGIMLGAFDGPGFTTLVDAPHSVPWGGAGTGTEEDARPDRIRANFQTSCWVLGVLAVSESVSFCDTGRTQCVGSPTIC